MDLQQPHEEIGLVGELVENIFHGNASVFGPRLNAGTGEEEPTILIVRDDETYREISLSLREPQTICKRAMMATNQPNLFVRLMEVHEEPLSDEIRAARIEDMSEVEILATHITSSSVHDLLSLDNSMSQVSLALCNAKRAQQLQAMASMDEGSIHFGEAENRGRGAPVSRDTHAGQLKGRHEQQLLQGYTHQD